MTDIVEMLRKSANQEFGTYDIRDDSVRMGCGTLRDAANEIETLRAKVADLEGYYGTVPDRSGPAFTTIKGAVQ